MYLVKQIFCIYQLILNWISILFKWTSSLLWYHADHSLVVNLCSQIKLYKHQSIIWCYQKDLKLYCSVKWSLEDNYTCELCFKFGLICKKKGGDKLLEQILIQKQRKIIKDIFLIYKYFYQSYNGESVI